MWSPLVRSKQTKFKCKGAAGCPTTPVRSLNTTQESNDILFHETEMTHL